MKLFRTRQPAALFEVSAEVVDAMSTDVELPDVPNVTPAAVDPVRVLDWLADEPSPVSSYAWEEPGSTA